MMTLANFNTLLYVMSALALMVFVALYFVKAGYGMFRTARWGISLPNKLAWVLMEAPVFVVMFVLWARSGAAFAFPQYLFSALSASLPATLVHLSAFDEGKKPDADSCCGDGRGV